MSGDDTDTRPMELQARAGERTPHLLVFCRGQIQSLHLEDGCRRTIGRSSKADVTVDDGLVSRQHLEVQMTGDSVYIQDLGSSNGTRLNGALLEGRAELASGDVVSIGVTQLVLQRSSRPATSQPVLGADNFGHRLAAEMERSLRYGRPLTLLLADAGGRDDALEAALTPGLRAMDQLGRREDGGLALVLPELAAASAPTVAERILARARTSFPGVRAGMASWPEDGHDAASLEAAAGRALQAAAPGQLRRAEQAATTVDVGGREVVFANPGMLQLVALMRRLAPTGLPVLITGETGSGKEIFARGLHHYSERSGGPFVAVNSAALPEGLAECELFGHVRGAFTGADGDREGKMVAASGGTLFLDEIGDMPAAVQAKLLRVIEDRAVIPLGANRPIPIDTRIVAATHRDLRADAGDGRFRIDLYYRLSGASLAIPPLRERPRDVPNLVHATAAEVARRLERTAPSFTARALDRLQRHPWPGNVRELRNLIDLLVSTAARPTIDLDAVDAALPAISPVAARTTGRIEAVAAERFIPLADQVRALEQAEIARALDAAGGVRKRAAELLGMPVRTLHAKLKQYPELAQQYPAPTRGG